MGDIVAIIPARGGSKGLPGKNTALVGGKSLIARAVMRCIRALSVDRIVVTTDSIEIKDEALITWSTYWRPRNDSVREIEIVDRPTELSTDTATTVDAVSHAVCECCYSDDHIVVTQCTSPLANAYDIDCTVERALDKGSALSVAPFTRLVWGYSGDLGCAFKLNFSKSTPKRRQDRALQYVENGAVYSIDAMAMIEHESLLTHMPGIHVMPRVRSIDVDTSDDLMLAETYRHMIVSRDGAEWWEDRDV